MPAGGGGGDMLLDILKLCGAALMMVLGAAVLLGFGIGALL